MRTILSMRQIINVQTLLITALAVISTWLCSRFGLVADFPLALIATAVVFPIVFSISGAYKRREATLDDYGSLKAHGRAIYFAVRDWAGAPDPGAESRARGLMKDLLVSCRELFHAPVSDMSRKEAEVYRAFSRLSRFVQELRGMGLASGEVSRCNQYLSKMIVAFESMKHIYQYRTPTTLRAYSKFFIYVLPVLYGPYFVHEAQEYSAGLLYVMPVLFSVIFVGLDNIQDHLENPFDQIGEDDVAINAEKFAERLALDHLPEFSDADAGLTARA